ncbi:hypothetical protein LINPERHAP2_LOCUS29847 [Linum perenne]
MAASKSYFARQSNYRFLAADHHHHHHDSSVFELDESDIYGHLRSESPEFRMTGTKISKKSSSAAGNRAAASSLPVNIPDWSKILKEEYRENRRSRDPEDADDDDDNDGEEYFDGGGMRVPPHELLARTRIASFSVHEGIGRTLKGRDLSRVRNAIWEKTGFQD